MAVREMKDSGVEWIGLIPKHWEITRVKNQFSIVCGATPKPDSCNWDGNIVWITPADMPDFGNISQGKRLISEIGYQSCGTEIVSPGSIVLSTRAPIGKVCIAEVDLCTNQGCKTLCSNIDAKSEFYKYVLYGMNGILQEHGTGTTFKELATSTLANEKIVLLPVDEQIHIANFLDAKCAEIDSLTVDIEKQIETLQEYKNSVITEAVTKGLNQKVEMKDSGVEWIGDIPIDWNMKTLSRVCQGFQNGTTETQLSYGESEYPVTRIETISQGVIDYSKVGFVSRISKKYLLKKNDFLISNINSIANIGKSAMYYGEAPLYHGMNLLRISTKEVEPMFLKYFFKSNYFLCTAQRLCKPAINQASLANSLLKRIKMPVPPVVEQAIIANFLDSKCAEIDATIEEKQKQLETLAQYKQSLIYEYVTGKKAVPM